ncbi:ABC transporter ATP-binding protein [Pseudonocardia sp. RS11V-5]|uniref:ABC transporter ATP-binding protein n=1 Tax=Pseudonocardia terrae TaxID=2905831 RepID=UPI001E3F7118|nr:ABC transporter ATP-binding protein [Pseudonocardia terrae]MCE3550878.1 ABC transporter ATP-binding protein [Pseudonocardia terrae]
MNDAPLLEITGLEAGYSGSRVLDGVDLAVHAGEAVVVVGPNGAGKSTLLKTISGLIRAGGGRIRFDGDDVTNWPTHRLVAAGIVQVPEGRQVFPGLSVAENLRLGAFALGRSTGATDDRLDQVLHMFPRLRERYGQDAENLSGGEQQMLAIGRGLMARPRLLMVDEPTLGLAPVVVQQLIGYFAYIRSEFDTTLLVAEQNLYLLEKVADRGCRLADGRLSEYSADGADASRDGLLGTYAGEIGT